MDHHNASERAAGCDGPASVPKDAHVWWIRALSHLPWSVIYALSTFVLGVMRYVLRYRVRVAHENLRRCFPSCSEAQIDRLLAQNYRHLAQVVAEFFKTASMSAEELRSRVRLVNLDKVHAETRAGRSVLPTVAGKAAASWPSAA